MEQSKYAINPNAMSDLITEIKLSINDRLHKKGYITEEMYVKAKKMIIKAA